MSLKNIVQGAAGAQWNGVAGKLDASDVFSTYLYTGNGTTQNINNGIDLAGKGGMVWIKDRTAAQANNLVDTIRGAGNYLSSNTTDGNTFTLQNISAFTAGGFTVGDGTGSQGIVNTLNDKYTSWTFRKASKFFHQELKVHTNGTASTVDLSTLGTVGMVTVKSTGNTGNWFTWHKDLTAGNNLKLNLTDVQSTTNAYLSVSGTTLTIASTAPSDTYIVYAWAHDTSTDGIIQCGSYTPTTGEGYIDLGWEPQYIVVKKAGSANTAYPLTNWEIYDNMRGLTVSQDTGRPLIANLANAETGQDIIRLTNRGFFYRANENTSHIYMAIRRPNKVPTSGTEVYNAIVNAAGSGSATVSIGFPTDMAFAITRDGTNPQLVVDRMRGNNAYLYSNTTGAEQTFANTARFDYQNSFAVLFGSAANVLQCFRRAPGFMDVVCYTGTGVARTVNHNLGVVPELMIVKKRTGTVDNWMVYHKDLSANGALRLNLTDAYFASTWWNNASPSTTVFSVGTNTEVNDNTQSHVAYLFSTLAGISKVGSYTGNGTSQTINCGFSTGARFILIKRTDSTGDWYIWDTVRGIVAGNDPYLSLNTTAAEVTTDDTIDPEATGFIVNQNTATNINVTSATYIFLAIS